MPEFITCSACGLRHSLRADGICPRCKRIVGNVPIEAAAPGGIYTPVVAGPVDGDGSFGFGCILGLVFGLVGAIACHVFARPATKQGANYGVLARIAIVVVLLLVTLASQGR
jgi:hypothetical protein